MTLNAGDALKYAAALLRQRTEWTTDSIAGTDCNGDHEPELDAIEATALELHGLAAQFGDPLRYSDGRLVKSSREIERGLVTEHIWHPHPAAEEPRSWRGTLRHDPGEPCPGVYEVSTTPTTQEIHVRTVRTV
jgi:hypothetical protein